MASLERIRRDIRDIAKRPKGVRAEEIERIVEQLGLLGYSTSSRRTSDGVLYRVKGCRFGICTHKGGDGHLLSAYVREFLSAMAELELY